MNVEDIVRDRVKDIGITVAELARRCSINDVLLRRSLDGKRSIKCKELISICHELDLNLSDFDALVDDHQAS